MKTQDQASTTTEAAAVAAPGAPVAPKKAASTKAASPKKTAPKGRVIKPASKKPAAKKPGRAEASVPRAFSKKAIVLDLLDRKGGATLAEICKATNWQAHSVRGFLSTANKKGLAKIESAKDEAGERTYRIVR